MSNLHNIPRQRFLRISFFLTSLFVTGILFSCKSSQDYPYAIHTKKKNLNRRTMGSTVDPAYDAYYAPELYGSRRSKSGSDRAEISKKSRSSSSSTNAPTFERISRGESYERASISSSRKKESSSFSGISLSRSKKVRGGACNGGTCTFK